MEARRSVLSSAKLIAACTLISRIAGMARDTLLGALFGLGWVADAFTYAFQFPNLFRRLFGEGSLAPVFVPTFTKTLHQEGRDSAWNLLASTFTLMTVALLAVLVAIELILACVWFLVPVEPANVESRRLLLSLTAIMMPFMVTVCLLALFSAILNCLGSFVAAALAPVVLNIGMIATMVWIAPALRPGNDDAAKAAQAHIVAWAIVATGVLQLLFIWPELRRRGVPIRWRWSTGDASVRTMLAMLPPVALGQGVLAFGVFLDSQICVLLIHKAGTPLTVDWFGFEFTYPLSEGALAALSYAQRLYQFPLGVLAISLATAALPAFSAHAARSDWTAWSDELRKTMRFAIFEGILAGAMMVAIAEPIVRLLFQYGRFSADDAARTARVLAWYGPGMWAFCGQHMILRGFYSIGDARTPLAISVAVLPLNVLITLTLIGFGVREPAFAIASSTTASIAVVVGLVILQRRVSSRLIDWNLLGTIARMVIAAAISGAAVYFAAQWIPVIESPAFAMRLGIRAVSTLGGLALGTGIFLAAAHLMGLGEARALLRTRKRPSTIPS